MTFGTPRIIKCAEHFPPGGDFRDFHDQSLAETLFTTAFARFRFLCNCAKIGIVGRGRPARD
jgi:hypothetical protein